MEVLEALLPLILLGLITYFAIARIIPNLNRASRWLWWLVMMMPAFIWSGWFLIVGDDKPLPTFVAIGPLILCFSMCYWLARQQRIKDNSQYSSGANQESQDSQSQTVPALTNPTEEIAQVRPITPAEEVTLRNCFPWNIYYLQHVDYRPQAIICRGRLRTNDKLAYQTIEENVKKAFDNRFFLIFQESFRGEPFFALVPNPWVQSPEQLEEQLFRPGLALTLLMMTLLTTTLVGVRFDDILSNQLESNPGLLVHGLPYSLGLVAILGIHELAHYLVGIAYKIRSTLPYFIPVPFFLGTFGAFIQRRSPIPHRQALFDIAVSGPLSGLIVTIPLLIWGLSMSEVVSLSDKSNSIDFSFDQIDPRFSFLFALLCKISLGSQFSPGIGINLHPLAIAGYLGLLVTALNLIPVGQLDGGNIVHAVFGQQTALIISQVTRLLALVFVLIYPTFWIWAVILWLMPIIDRPALNDVTELNSWRDCLGLFSLVILLVIILPLPGAIATWINI
jgi:membrane-associated protease RseP (regulator of RpoE activity)